MKCCQLCGQEPVRQACFTHAACLFIRRYFNGASIALGFDRFLCWAHVLAADCRQHGIHPLGSQVQQKSQGAQQSSGQQRQGGGGATGQACTNRALQGMPQAVCSAQDSQRRTTEVIDWRLNICMCSNRLPTFVI